MTNPRNKPSSQTLFDPDNNPFVKSTLNLEELWETATEWRERDDVTIKATKKGMKWLKNNAEQTGADPSLFDVPVHLQEDMLPGCILRIKTDKKRYLLYDPLGDPTSGYVLHIIDEQKLQSLSDSSSL